MNKNFVIGLLIVGSFMLFCCNRAENYKDAFLEKENGQLFIKLKGKRQLMVHDLGSLIRNNTYEDSLIIYIPEFKEGLIKEIKIPVDTGFYDYNGNVLVKGNHVTVTVYISDTAQKKNIPSFWSGGYRLVNDTLK